MRVLVLYGGRSGEHEVSVVSARAVVESVLALGHDAVCVGISPRGRWVRFDPRSADRVPEEGEAYALAPDPTASRDVDVAFPVLHGPYGEDGCVQGLFELADLPFVGAGVEGSAIGMNKVVHKRLFRLEGLPTVDFVSFRTDQWTSERQGLAERVDELGYPCFCKPARLGSSVGISKLHGPADLEDAVARASRHDDLVVIEAAGGSRELEIGVVESGALEMSVVGEVIPDGEWYDYRAKYRGEWTRYAIPADVPQDVSDAVAEMAARAFRTTSCAGLARVDFFWDPAGEQLLVNEINTLPGITPASMFPMLWEASGRSFAKVVGQLLDHAFVRHRSKLDLEASRRAAHDEEVGA